MWDDIKKSVNSILYERLSSPFYGTLIISWLIWNWKIIYLTLFIDQDKLVSNKIDYILDKCSNPTHLYIWPIVSTILLILIAPLITNGAYYISLIYQQWRLKHKNRIEGQQPLTIEQSVQLRDQIRLQVQIYAKDIEDKETEIKQLKSELNTLKEINSGNTKIIEGDHDKYFHTNEEQEIKELAAAFFYDQENQGNFNFLMSLIRSNAINIGQRFQPEFLNYLEGNQIIRLVNRTGKYELTERGIKFLKFAGPQKD